MIPNGAEGVRHLATRIITDLIPKAVDAYTTADLGLTIGLLDMVAQDYDRAVDVLISDQNDMRVLFEAALGSVGDQGLAERMSASVAARPTSLRVGDLSAQADTAMRVLIDLHAHVEAAEAGGEAWASLLNLKIWTFIDAHVARRAYDSAF